MIFSFNSQANMRKFLQVVTKDKPEIARTMTGRGSIVTLPGEQTEKTITDLAHSFGATIQEWSIPKET